MFSKMMGLTATSLMKTEIKEHWNLQINNDIQNKESMKFYQNAFPVILSEEVLLL